MKGKIINKVTAEGCGFEFGKIYPIISFKGNEGGIVVVKNDTGQKYDIEVDSDIELILN